MKAIIYAAGRGTRLQSDSPKILLKFGGKTLLEWHALRLREAGVREIVLVTGHIFASRLQNCFPAFAPGMTLRYARL